MRLSIVEDGGRSELEVDRPVVSVGRSIDNDIRLANTLVSRHHCRIEAGAQGAWVIDLGSANGTSVNGEKVSRRLLEPGDRIEVGGVSIELELDDLRPAAVEAVDALEGDDPGMRTLTGEAQRERDNLRVFARITRELARETELNPLLRAIVDSAVSLVGGERGFLLLADDRGGPDAGGELRSGGGGGGGDESGESGDGEVRSMRVRVARSFDHSDIPVPRSRLSLGIAARVIREERPVLSVDAGRDERFSGMASVEDLRLRSVVALPIRIEDRIEGVLYVDNRLQQNAFTQEDLDLVELFADQASIAIRNARLLAELRQRNERLESSRRQIEHLNEQLGRKVRDRDTELAVVRAELGRERGRYDYTSLVGASDGMRDVFRQLDRFIESDLPVLIQGESGTGKELIARAIHFNGGRAGKPFVTENCAAMPDTLLESELFGHARGAFTGAHKDKRGLLEQADGGTLFLDEIGDMSTEMQKKLLRVLQDGEFRMLGSDRQIQVDIRLLCASHKDLEELVAEGDFREDLFYRVNVLTVRLPPLRERRDDIPLLAEHLLARAAREAARPVPILPHEVVAALVSHDWPGNVRELENEMRRLVVLAQGEVRLEHVSRSVLERRGPRNTPRAAGPLPQASGDIKAAVAELERQSIEAALAQCAGNKSKAAAQLGISRFALQRKLDKYGLTRSRRGASKAEDDAEGDEDGSEDPAEGEPRSGPAAGPAGRAGGEGRS